jgi:hypothetical protein
MAPTDPLQASKINEIQAEQVNMYIDIYICRHIHMYMHYCHPYSYIYICMYTFKHIYTYV